MSERQPALWRRILAAGGLRLATWILAVTAIQKDRPPLRWISTFPGTADDPNERVRLSEVGTEDLSEKLHPHAWLILAPNGGTWRVEYPYELHSYARVLAALREKGFIP